MSGRFLKLYFNEWMVNKPNAFSLLCYLSHQVNTNLNSDSYGQCRLNLSQYSKEFNQKRTTTRWALEYLIEMGIIETKRCSKSTIITFKNTKYIDPFFNSNPQNSNNKQNQAQAEHEKNYPTTNRQQTESPSNNKQNQAQAEHEIKLPTTNRIAFQQQTEVFLGDPQQQTESHSNNKQNQALSKHKIFPPTTNRNSNSQQTPLRYKNNIRESSSLQNSFPAHVGAHVSRGKSSERDDDFLINDKTKKRISSGVLVLEEPKVKTEVENSLKKIGFVLDEGSCDNDLSILKRFKAIDSKKERLDYVLNIAQSGLKFDLEEIFSFIASIKVEIHGIAKIRNLTPYKNKMIDTMRNSDEELIENLHFCINNYHKYQRALNRKSEFSSIVNNIESSFSDKEIKMSLKEEFNNTIIDNLDFLISSLQKDKYEKYFKEVYENELKYVPKSFRSKQVKIPDDILHKGIIKKILINEKQILPEIFLNQLNRFLKEDKLNELLI